MSSVLVINPGATSKKYALFQDGDCRVEAVYEKTETGWQSTYSQPGQPTIQQIESEHSFQQALGAFIKQLTSTFAPGAGIDAVGIRVVAPGTFFQQHQLIDDALISRLQAQIENGQLHIPAILREIKQCQLLLPLQPRVAVSDTAFFAALPAAARSYSLPAELALTHDLYRFGYHGLSAAGAVARIHSVIGTDPRRLIICHLGGGSSVTGVVAGKPVYTSGGYSALDGLPMLTRSGDIDPGVLFQLLRVTGEDSETLQKKLYQQSGLYGLTDVTDMRLMLEKRSQGDPAAQFALEILCLKLQEAIAAASLATGGIDALVLTGTIGFRNPTFRTLLASRLEPFGINIDEDKNDTYLSKEGVISYPLSLTKVVVLKTSEMSEIARITRAVTTS